ncbi:MAG TPA: type II secretion system F family protein [Myxococcales bacterium]|nr:type II secretion system F family protein [Myxococcales bacterium]
MSDLRFQLLRCAAALLAGGCATAVALGARDLWLRLRGRRPVQAPGAPRTLRRLVVETLTPLNRRWVPPLRLQQLERALRRADQPIAAEEMVAWMEVCAALFLALGTAFTVLLQLRFYAPLLFAAFGAAYPLIWLRDRIRARQRGIVRALPFDLDLLTLSVEAGLDFAAALAKVVEKGRKGPLADELSIVLKELKLGTTREEALRNLAARAGVPSLTSFVQALVQADRMGTPLGKVLRILSSQMRAERTQRAEKLANEAPVKLLFPLICFIFPTLFLMLFGPIAYQMIFGGGF